ncbi:phage tail protein [Paenibacillus sp. NRS-1780]|uniref:phage tail-collar fiber domain-containing protein n=1 Tax=Paenibacillus sp. NRS-1780 TaxID=3233904 RepID=UPI003D26EE2E
MAAFGGLVLTIKGRNLQAKVQAGQQLKFSRMGLGDGVITSQSIPNMTGLITERKSIAVNRVYTPSAGRATVSAILSNQDITTGFFFRELGVFAIDPDEGEIMYAYGNSGSGSAEYIPPGGGADVIEKLINVNLLVGNATNISITADPSQVYVSLQEYTAYTTSNDVNILDLKARMTTAETDVDDLQDRLNKIDTKKVTLAAGVQVLNSIKSALFSLDGITGRMLVNLLGRMGNCENVGSWSSNVAIVSDTTNKTSGTSSFKLTLGSVPATASASFLTTPGRKYIAVTDAKNGNASKVSISINVTGTVGNEVTTASTFAPSVVRFAATDFFHIVTVTGTGAAGNTFNMDSVRVYEVSDTDYAAAATLTPAQAAAKWPYVDSVMPVRNPYAIRWTDANRTDIASMLALQTDLYADPVTGANADTVFERNGQYYKSKRFESVTIDGSRITAVNGVEVKTGFKIVYPRVSGVDYQFGAPGTSAAKYDGKILMWGSHDSAPDRWSIDRISLNFAISVSNSDSGWGEGYTPTTDEVRAYFLGWRMRNQTTLDPYTSGVKAWGSLISGGTDYYTNTLPTTVALDYKTPYQLVYQLATPTVEPIVSEGQLTFNEGDNQVEVGTGIVLRERSKAVYTNSAYYINGRTDDPSILKNRVNKILAVYRDGKKDSSWVIAPVSDQYQSTYGKEQVYTLTANFNLSSSYNTTYLMLEPSPVVPFTGSYAANEKTLLADLVDSVQQTSTRLSVIENKKAEKDAPSWITPTTLLNGWVSMGVLGYRKIDNKVQVKARIKSGVIGQPFMILPEGYRPLVGQVRPVHSYTTTDVFAAVLINADGKFIVSGGSNNEVNIYLEFTTD